MKNIGWLKQMIKVHLAFTGSRYGVVVKRQFHQDRIVVDFMGGGRCATYTYSGKHIAG